MTGLWVLLAAAVAASGLGLLLRRRDGRFRPAGAARRLVVPGQARADRQTDCPVDDLVVGSRAESSVESAAEPPVEPTVEAAQATLTGELAALGERPGERATLLQFSSAFCAPCRATRQVLAGVVQIVPGVRHVEVDAEAHLDLVRRLRVRRTPTVLVLDGAGREVHRASGAPPSRAAVLAALAAVTPGD
jgi:thiol-disulfide isomerase/thioredoxin